MTGRLTAAEVTGMLSAAGVDVAALDVTEDGADVVVRGPVRSREAARGVLRYRYGLTVAPFPDCDVWTR